MIPRLLILHMWMCVKRVLHLLQSLHALVDGSGQAHQGLDITRKEKNHHERGRKQTVDGVSDNHLPKVKPMNLFLLVSRKCSMSFSLRKHTPAAGRLAGNALVSGICSLGFGS